MGPRREGSVTAWSVACVLAWLAACGGGDGVTNPTPSPTPPPAPVQIVVGQGNFSIDAPDSQYSYFVRRSISTSAAGALNVTVDWTHATNTVWMYLSEGACSVDQFASDACPGSACPCRFSVISEQSGPKPRVLSVPNASAGGRALFVWNLGPKAEGCSFQAVLTTTSGASVHDSQNDAEVEMAAKRSR